MRQHLENWPPFDAANLSYLLYVLTTLALHASRSVLPLTRRETLFIALLILYPHILVSDTSCDCTYK